MDEMVFLKPKLVRLKLSGILENLELRLKEATQGKWAYTHFLLRLFEDEVARRDNKQMGLRLSRSGLDPRKTLELFNFSFNRMIHEPTIRELAGCSFIERKECVLLLGPSGVGKSHLAQAFGHEACRRGHDVLFRRTYSLFQWIRSGRADDTHARRLMTAIRAPLLILDDFGLKPLDADMQDDLYEVICERYEQAPTVVTSNRDWGEWPGVFSNPLMGSAAMDRLVHQAVRIVIEGPSYRMDNFARREKGLTASTEET